MSAFLRGLELQQGVHRLDRRGQPAPPSATEETVPAAPARTVNLQAQVDQARARLEEEQRSWRQQAEQELAALRQKVSQEGREAGHAQGLAEGRESYEQKVRQLDGVIDRLGALLGAELEQAQDLVVAIAYEAITKILGDVVVTPDGVRAVVAQAIAGTRQQEKLVVRVPAQDYRLLIDALPASDALARPGIEIRPDAQLADGGCVIDTDAGQLDARLGTQLAALRTVLLQVRKQSPAGRA